MHFIDWLVLVTTLLLIVVYGIYKGRRNDSVDSFLRADRAMPWYQIWLSVMATQASAITFLSGPGQAYNNGMGFVQFYFGLPLAMIVISYTFIPIFRKLNVYTAYEFLENRFDLKTRTLTSALFLLQRGLSTGISIYAPAIILSTIFQADIAITTLIMGCLVVFYTVWGGAKTVSHTQFLQMIVIFGGLFVTGVLVVKLLPAHIGLGEALHLAGSMGKTKALDTTFDPNNRYNLWSGLIGGFFLQLSYFGTDQSQVGRYLTGKNEAESKIGLLLNGLVKIPMQFGILLLGVLVFVYYQYNQPPIFFNQYELDKVRVSEKANDFKAIENAYQQVFEEKKKTLLTNSYDKNTIQLAQKQLDSLRKEGSKVIKSVNPNADDKDYIFIHFILNKLPRGLVGLLMAIIILAAMGSLASALASLGSATAVDFYKRFSKVEIPDNQYLSITRWITVVWGIFCILMAFTASRFGNLIEAVNVLGSWFYGTILGVFLVAFYLKNVKKGSAVFWGAILAEIIVLIAYYADWMAFLWLNVLGCVLVMIFSWILEKVLSLKSNQ
jgi:solute:Na+ symporter, SSS family